MSYQLTWLADVLYAAGLKVAEFEGWQNRGAGDMGMMRGVLCHHTAGPRAGNMPSLDTLINGRPDLSGPLAHLGLGRDGTFYVLAAGRCNHAGTGAWQSVTTGNSSFIGIEAENTGSPDDPWPEAQIDAYHRGAAAILARLGRGAEWCAGHREYALPAGRKTDPSFDMEAFRASVAAHLSGTALRLEPIPSREPDNGAGAGRPTLRRGATGAYVRQVQEKLGIAENPQFDAAMEARVREFQRIQSLVPDGIIGPQTWRALDEGCAGLKSGTAGL
jgi:N-acetylmuramoyl-L-alanine amidase-like protein/putative peptidoglycan binding protein